VTCPSCGHEVPEGTFCIRCGAPLRGAEGTPARARREYSVAPHEPVHRPALISSLFPHLPRASMATFRIGLGFGVAVVLALAVAKLYPLALVAAAVLVPLLTVLYLYDVDVYEDEPLTVVAFTMVWGAAAGVWVGVLARQAVPSGVDFFVRSTGSMVAVQGLGLPALAVVLGLAGPLVLLGYRRFNDVLDGATFGAASAVSLAGAEVITQAFAFLSQSGVRPSYQIVPWVVRLLELAVAAPVLAAATVGAAAAAFWLRFRAPVRDRRALGVFGRPEVAVVTALALVVAASVSQLLLPKFAALAVYVVLDALALVWLRRVLHLGLLEEAAEVGIGPDITCANCGATTPASRFCINCGISLQALPKSRPPAPLPAPPTTGGSP
jgi:hypothetical protein